MLNGPLSGRLVDVSPSITLRRYGPSRGSHAHGHAQVLWTLDGALELELNGRGQRLTAGQGLLIPPGALHDFEAPQGSECLVLDSADPAWLGRAPRPLHVQPVDHLARFLAASLEQGLPVSQALGAQLLAQAWGPGEVRAVLRSGRPIDWAGLQRWVQTRLAAPLTVADLAARAAVSPATLHRRFRTGLGTTPLAWLTGERVAFACRLIERGEKRLDVVAALSGLGTAANLRARLRRETGLSPSAYRRRFGPAGEISPAGEAVPV